MTLDPCVPDVVSHLFGASVRAARRMDYGHANAVYDVTLADGREIIVRLNANPNVMKATSENIAVLRRLGLPVPTVIAEDRSRTRFPFDAMVLAKIPGRDLRYEMPAMDRGQLARLAAAVEGFQRTVAALPPGADYGWAPIGGRGGFPTWEAVVRRDVDAGLHAVADRLPAGAAHGVENAFERHRRHLLRVPPKCFLDDLTTKNVILRNGELQGIVDFDCVCYGDPLYTIALTQTAVIADVPEAGGHYVDALCRAGHHNEDDRRIADFYSVVFAMDFLRRETAEGTRARLTAFIASWAKRPSR